MKQTVSLSRMDEIMSPLASRGVAGQTTLRPGVLARKFSGVWEWVAPTLVPPLAGPRMTIGTLMSPPDM